jgi:hypothetical protein
LVSRRFFVSRSIALVLFNNPQHVNHVRPMRHIGALLATQSPSSQHSTQHVQVISGWFPPQSEGRYHRSLCNIAKVSLPSRKANALSQFLDVIQMSPNTFSIH